jgi:hypothetical protein
MCPFRNGYGVTGGVECYAPGDGPDEFLIWRTDLEAWPAADCYMVDAEHAETRNGRWPANLGLLRVERLQLESSSRGNA